MSTKKVMEVIEVAFSGGQGRSGVEFGPETLIKHGLLEQLNDLGWQVDHNKDLKVIPKPESDPVVNGCKNSKYVSIANKKLYSAVRDSCKAKKTTLVIGGDHSLAIGSIAGSAEVYPDICVIWIDAHADLNTPDTTDSGNLHGCPLSFLLKLPGTEKVPELNWVPKCINADSLVYIGLRDVDAGERKLLKDHKIKAFSMHDVDKHGIGKIVEMALDHVNPKRNRPIHLSYDVDALDPTVAPATGTPVRGGLTFREGHYIAEAIAETGKLVVMDIMEVNPILAIQRTDEPTATVACSLIRASFGETLL